MPVVLRLPPGRLTRVELARVLGVSPNHAITLCLRLGLNDYMIALPSKAGITNKYWSIDEKVVDIIRDSDLYQPYKKRFAGINKEPNQDFLSMAKKLVLENARLKEENTDLKVKNAELLASNTPTKYFPVERMLISQADLDIIRGKIREICINSSFTKNGVEHELKKLFMFSDLEKVPASMGKDILAKLDDMINALI